MVDLSHELCVNVYQAGYLSNWFTSMDLSMDLSWFIQKNNGYYMALYLIISDYDGDMDWYVDNPVPTLNIPDTPWFSRGFTHIWDHTMGVFYI